MDRDEARCTMGKLIINNKNYKICKGLNVIGRNRTAHVILCNPNISQTHAIIIVINENEHYISEVSSTNGTYIDNIRLKPNILYPINDDSHIRLADVHLKYVVDKSNLSFTQDNTLHGTQMLNILNMQTTQHLSNENATLPHTESTSNLDKNNRTPSVHEMCTQIFQPQSIHEQQTQISDYMSTKDSQSSSGKEQLVRNDENSNESVVLLSDMNVCSNDILSQVGPVKKKLKPIQTDSESNSSNEAEEVTIQNNDSDNENVLSQMLPVKRKSRPIESDDETTDDDDIVEKRKLNDDNSYIIVEPSLNNITIDSGSETDLEMDTVDETILNKTNYEDSSRNHGTSNLFFNASEITPAKQMNTILQSLSETINSDNGGNNIISQTEVDSIQNSQPLTSSIVRKFGVKKPEQEESDLKLSKESLRKTRKETRDIEKNGQNYIDEECTQFLDKQLASSFSETFEENDNLTKEKSKRIYDAETQSLLILDRLQVTCSDDTQKIVDASIENVTSSLANDVEFDNKFSNMPTQIITDTPSSNKEAINNNRDSNLNFDNEEDFIQDSQPLRSLASRKFQDKMPTTQEANTSNSFKRSQEKYTEHQEENGSDDDCTQLLNQQVEVLFEENGNNLTNGDSNDTSDYETQPLVTLDDINQSTDDSFSNIDENLKATYAPEEVVRTAIENVMAAEADDDEFNNALFNQPTQAIIKASNKNTESQHLRNVDDNSSSNAQDIFLLNTQVLGSHKIQGDSSTEPTPVASSAQTLKTAFTIDDKYSQEKETDEIFSMCTQKIMEVASDVEREFVFKKPEPKLKTNIGNEKNAHNDQKKANDNVIPDSDDEIYLLPTQVIPCNNLEGSRKTRKSKIPNISNETEDNCDDNDDIFILPTQVVVCNNEEFSGNLLKNNLNENHDEETGKQPKENFKNNVVIDSESDQIFTQATQVEACTKNDSCDLGIATYDDDAIFLQPTQLIETDLQCSKNSKQSKRKAISKSKIVTVVDNTNISKSPTCLNIVLPVKNDKKTVTFQENKSNNNDINMPTHSVESQLEVMFASQPNEVPLNRPSNPVANLLKDIHTQSQDILQTSNLPLAENIPTICDEKQVSALKADALNQLYQTDENLKAVTRKRKNDSNAATLTVASDSRRKRGRKSPVEDNIKPERKNTRSASSNLQRNDNTPTLTESLQATKRRRTNKSIATGVDADHDSGSEFEDDESNIALQSTNLKVQLKDGPVNLASTSKESTTNNNSKAKRTRNNQKHNVIFTRINDKNLEQIIKNLGGSVCDVVAKSTVLVAEDLTRTPKVLEAIALSKPICSKDWLYDSQNAKSFLDPWDYLINDKEAESKWNFCLRHSLESSSKKKLLEAYKFQIATEESKIVLKGVIEAAGGKCLTRAPVDKTNFYVVTDVPKKNKIQYKNIKPEAIFVSVLKQIINFDEHLL